MDKSESDRKIYSDREKILLMSLVEKFKHIIENKKTDGTNLVKKTAAWKQITELYNSNDVTSRTEKQLKKLWDNLKQRTRKNDSEMKKQIIQTGGGPPPDEDKDPLNEMVRQIVPTINLTLDNPWDSTSLTIIKNSESDCQLDKLKETDISNNNSIMCQLSDERENATESFHRSEDTLNQEKSCYKNIFTPVGPKRKRKSSCLSPSASVERASLIEQEASLRLEKLKRSIEQQEELHIIRMQAAEAEKIYWEKRTELLSTN